MKAGAEQASAEETYELDATELLGAFKDSKEETEAEAKSAVEVMQDFMADLRAVDRDNEVNRILWAFKLNPFEKMNLRFDSTESDVKKQYRRAHPGMLPSSHVCTLCLPSNIAMRSLASPPHIPHSAATF